MRRLFVCLFVLAFAVLPLRAQPALQPPSDFLGYRLGTEFTPHHRVMDYVRHVAQASPNVVLDEYGRTYEGRPLVLLTVATPENLARRETIRTAHLASVGLGATAGPEAAEVPAEVPAFVWLSYNVHGNESVSTEAAMQTLYELADPANARTQAWLDDVIVLLDPCLNPDGRERYVQWYKRTRGATPNPDPDAREHYEPWPGGRTNHYYFDLNRDWAWQSQIETQQRLVPYLRWMPHVHVDFHEQGVEEPYYFAPAAEPYHERISEWQRAFQVTIGRNHARYFDAAGWLYFTRQRFDLFYPSYGDTWPTFNGAIGMTYEQGGSGRAGLAIRTSEGDTLSLADRIRHHHTTGLSTVEVTAQHAQAVVDNFRAYYASARQRPEGVYRTYVVKAGEAPERLAALAAYLDRQGIRYGQLSRARDVEGFSYAAGAEARTRVEPADLVVSTYQPKSVLVNVLFEPEAALEDSLTYDITAWALPYAYNLDAFALESRIEPDRRGWQAPAVDAAAPLPSARPYAYLVEWGAADDLRMLSALLQEGVRLRFAERPFDAAGRTFDAGTLVLTRTGNDGDFDARVRTIAERFGARLVAAPTGFVARGADFGSSDVPYLRAPRVAAVAGEMVSPYALGAVWHYFDQQIRYPLTLLPADDWSRIELDDYDVLILPSGSYGDLFGDERLAELRAWVRRGGRLIAVDGAVRFLAGQEGFALKRKDDEADDDSTVTVRRYGERAREAISDDVPGAVYRLRLDGSHPLGFGLGDAYFTLKRGDDTYAYLDDGWNVGVLEAGAHRSGFAGYRARERLRDTLVYGVEDMGRGSVVYLVDDPLFRGFWEAGKVLFGNAVFLVGQR